MAASSEYIESIQRLAIGLDVLDALSQRTVSYPVRADVEYGLPHDPPKPNNRFGFAQQRGKLPLAMNRHDRGRYSLVYQTGLEDHVDIRIYDHHRQYVPRRLRLPLLTLQDVLDIETNEESEHMRGRVLRDGEPMPWSWIEAYSTVDDELVGRARGDERGEFLLLINSIVAGAGDLAASYDVRVRVFGPQLVDAPSPADLPDQDPLWNLPLEIVPAAGDPDAVTPGEALPAGYVEGASAVVPCITGRVLTGVDTADFEFTVA